MPRDSQRRGDRAQEDVHKALPGGASVSWISTGLPAPAAPEAVLFPALPRVFGRALQHVKARGTLSHY